MKGRINIFTIIIIAFILMIELLKCIVNSPFINESVIIYSIEYILITVIAIFNIKDKLFTIKNLFVFLFAFMIGLAPICYYINKGNLNSMQFSLIIISYLFFILGLYCKINWKDAKKKKTLKYYIKIEYVAIIMGCIAILANLYYILTNAQNFFSNNLEEERINALSSNGLIMLIAGLIIPSIGILFDRCFKEDNKKYKIILICFISLATICYLIQGSRTPIIKIIIILLLIYNLKKPLKNKTIIIILAIGIIMLIGMQIMRLNRSGEESNFTRLLLNTLQNSSINLNYVMDIFPEQEDFQHGYTYLINIIMLRPGPDLDFTLWLKEKIGLKFAGGGITPTIIGESYLNFGTYGSYLILFLIGILINFLDWKYFNSKKNAFWICYFITIFIDSFRGGLANIEIGLLTYLALYIFIEKILRIKEEKSDENCDDRT